MISELRLRYAISANLTRIDERRSKLSGYNPYALAKYLDRGDEAAEYILKGEEPEAAARKAGLIDPQLIRAIVEAAKGKTLNRKTNRYITAFEEDAATKKNPRKRRSKTTRARKCRTRTPRRPRVAVLKVNTKKRASAEKFVIRGRESTRAGYTYYYVHGDRFLIAKKGADEFGRSAGIRHMKKIAKNLPLLIDAITLEKVR